MRKWLIAAFILAFFAIVPCSYSQTYYEVIQFRRGTAATWTSTNPVLASGEPGFETDTGKVKVGDGLTAWVSLPYLPAGWGTWDIPTQKLTIPNLNVQTGFQIGGGSYLNQPVLTTSSPTFSGLTISGSGTITGTLSATTVSATTVNASTNLIVHGTTLTAPATSLTYVLPSSHVTNGYLKNDGKGTLTWSAVGTGTGSFVENGYAALPGGLYIQWGKYTPPSGHLSPDTAYTVTWPTAFPNAFLNAQATIWNPTGSIVGGLLIMDVVAGNTTQGTFMSNYTGVAVGYFYEEGFYWMAIGY